MTTIANVYGAVGGHPLFEVCAAVWCEAKGFHEPIGYNDFVEFMRAMATIVPPEAWHNRGGRIAIVSPGQGLVPGNVEWRSPV